MENRRLDAVQGLRGLAALLVVVAHSILSLVEKAGLDPAQERFAWPSGEMGVRMFFAISGFVMVYTTAESFSKGGASLRFFLKRLLRIIPLYYLMTVVYFIQLMVQAKSPQTHDLVLSLAFVPYMNAKGLFQPLYGPGWTLNYEMFFYFLFSLALFLRFRAGITAVCVLLLSLVFLGTRLPQAADAGFWMRWLIFVCNPIMAYFVIGILIGCVRVRTKISVSSLSVPSTLLICALLSSAVVIFARGPWAKAVGMGLAALATVTLTALRLSEHDGHEDHFHVRTIRRLGDASYSIYLTHGFLIGPCARVWGAFFKNFNQAWPLFVLVMLVGCSILGLIVYRFVEKPMVDILRKRMAHAV